MTKLEALLKGRVIAEDAHICSRAVTEDTGVIVSLDRHDFGAYTISDLDKVVGVFTSEHEANEPLGLHFVLNYCLVEEF